MSRSLQEFLLNHHNKQQQMQIAGINDSPKDFGVIPCLERSFSLKKTGERELMDVIFLQELENPSKLVFTKICPE